MSCQLHFGKVFQVEYDYSALYGWKSKEAFYHILQLFGIIGWYRENSDQDCEISREQLRELHECLTRRDALFLDCKPLLNKDLEDMGVTLNEFIKVLDGLINDSDQSNDYVLLSWF